MKRILGVGNSLTDILVRTQDDRLIQMLGYQKGSMNLIDQDKMHEIESLLTPESIQIRSGGSAANTIHALSTLGIPCSYIGKTGNDETGRHFVRQLSQVGVDVIDIPAGSAPSGRCYVFISPDGERTFATYLGSALELCAQDVKAAHFSTCDLVHVEGYLLQNPKLIRRVFSLAKENGKSISLDLASYNVVLANLEVIKSLCSQYVGILFANEEEGKAFAGTENEEAILDNMAAASAISILKLGERGARVLDGDGVLSIDAVPADVRDTTGAGDIFAAGFLAAYAHNQSRSVSLQWGAQLAAEIIAVIGARLPQETIERYKADWGI